MIQLTFHLLASEFPKESRNFFKFIHTLFKRAKQDCSSSTLSPYKRRRRKVTKANPQYTHTHTYTNAHSRTRNSNFTILCSAENPKHVTAA